MAVERFSFRPGAGAAAGAGAGGAESGGSGIERRRYERVVVNLEVDYRADETFLFAYITDISAMGIFMRTDHPSPPGTQLMLRFSPPGGPVIECHGEVIWINPYRPGSDEHRQPGMGIQFADLDEDSRLAVLRLVNTFAYLDDEREDDISRH